MSKFITRSTNSIKKNYVKKLCDIENVLNDWSQVRSRGKPFWRNEARAWLSISIITIRNPYSLATRRPPWHALASAMLASKLAEKNSKMNLKSALLQLRIAPPRPDRPNMPINALVLILTQSAWGPANGGYK